ncbi:MAG: ABC transporter ATP-binding protein [Christensenellaceae bacterium]
MVKLIKYLKPFVVLILVSIVLLFGQAICDLSLPNYMSEIVNVGIQQGGVQDAVPQALSGHTMGIAQGFMSDAQKTAVQKNYTLIDAQSTDYEKYAAKYPALSTQNIYVQNKMNEQTRSSLNNAFAYSFAAINSINQMSEADISGKDGIKTAEMTQLPADLTAFLGHIKTSGTDFFTALSTYPQADAVTASINQLLEQKFAGMDESMLTQMAIPAIVQEYQALGMDTAKLSQDYIWHDGFIMLLLSLVSAVCSIVVGLLSAKVGAGLAQNLREKVFTKVSNFSNIEFDQFSTASLITRSTNDVTQVQMLVMIMIRMVIYAPIMGIGGVIMANAKSVSMSWVIALAVVVLLGLILSIFVIVMPKFKRVQALIDRLNLVMRENLSGLMVVRAFNTQEFELNRFDETNKDLTKTNLFVNKIMVMMMPVMMLIMNAVSILIVWVGAQQIAGSAMQVGDMMAFMQYAMQILMSFLMLSMIFIMLPRASVSARRIAEVLDTKTTIHNPKNPKKYENCKGVLAFEHVDFAYPNAEDNVLTDINFTAYPGQTTAVIGSTGSGKSTIANLIPRFYDVTAGAVTIDGVDIRETEQHDLRDKVGYVPQKSVLFSGTIDSNLRLGDERATTEQIEQAAKAAQAMEFIEDNENKFEARISQDGANVSGGQKQRLSIARALVKNPQIYVFDDSFSALDFKTDAILRNAIKEQTKDKTVLIIAQRVGTIMDAQQIIVLDEGRIVGKGTHKELMQTCEQYKEIALSQLSEEELSK